ncbi:hypothetical protein ACJRO7_032803 [Eucalyptus globulus]|uniref:Uncharacterized protein n=1 Tax=Eucalyptus globulus TaxID=34317 RepID=A0ABD3JPG6_EUCGL
MSGKVHECSIYRPSSRRAQAVPQQGPHSCLLGRRLDCQRGEKSRRAWGPLTRRARGKFDPNIPALPEFSTRFAVSGSYTPPRSLDS